MAKEFQRTCGQEDPNCSSTISVTLGNQQRVRTLEANDEQKLRTVMLRFCSLPPSANPFWIRPPEQALKALRENEEMHVLGVPRISLNLISWRRDHSKENKKVLDWALPYEIVIVGCYETVPISD